MTNITGDGNPQFNVAATLDHQSLEWTFSTELVEEWVISKNFKITKGSINIDSNYDAGLTLGLEVKLGQGNNTRNTTFEVIMAKTGQFYNITGTANDFPKVTILCLYISANFIIDLSFVWVVHASNGNQSGLNSHII